MDLPGCYGLLGVGFLNKFLPYSIKVLLADQKRVCITTSKSKELIVFPGVPAAHLQSQLHISDLTGSDAPCLAVQRDPPSRMDLANIEGQFQVSYDLCSGCPVLEAPDPLVPSPPGVQYLDTLL